MAIFGCNEIGTYAPINIGDVIRGSKYQCPRDGVAESITVYLRVYVKVARRVRCMIYDSNFRLLGTTKEKLVAPGVDWITFDFPAPKPTLTAGAYYWLVAWSEDMAGGGVLVYPGPGEYRQGTWHYKDYNLPPDPLVPGGWSDDRMSIFCTYTPLVGIFIHGYVKDAETGQPISGALVDCEVRQMLTDEIGYYEFELSPAVYNVTASASGYVEQTKTVDASVPGDYSCDFNLSKIAKRVFGYTKVGGMEIRPGYDPYTDGNCLFGAVFTAPESGIAENITVYLNQHIESTPRIKCAIYRHTDLRLIGVTEEWMLTSGWMGWKTFKFSAPKPRVEAGVKYVLVMWDDGDPTKESGYGGVYLRADDGEIEQGHSQPLMYSGFPDPASFVHNNMVVSIYCEYSPTPVRLEINSSPVTGVTFTIDGLSETTPFLADVDAGTYTITMPETVTVNGTTYRFVKWADGPTERIRTVDVVVDTSLTANYEVVPVTHTLNVQSSPITGISVTVDESPIGATPTSVEVVEGGHVISVPPEVEV
jgi:hypothetical protein